MLNSNDLKDLDDLSTKQEIVSEERLIDNLFRKCLFKDGSKWTALDAKITKGQNDIKIMQDPEGNEYFVKDLTKEGLSPIREISGAAMMRFYLGKNKTTEYMILHKDNKEYVASKAVDNPITLKHSISLEPKIDQEEFQLFKKTFIDKYVLPNWEIGIPIWYNNSQDKEQYIENFKTIINPTIYNDIKIFERYHNFFIEQWIIETLKNPTYRKPESSGDNIHTFIAKNCNLKSEGDLTEEDKQKIKQFCNKNLEVLSLRLYRPYSYNIDSIKMLEALGGPNSPLVEEYIKLQLANFEINNVDGHWSNILLKLADEGKAKGVVAIDFDRINQLDCNTGLTQYNLIKEILDHERPGMVERIEKEFNKSIQKPQMLHDLAALLGAKEEEYRRLNNIEVSDLVNQTLATGPDKGPGRSM